MAETEIRNMLIGLLFLSAIVISLTSFYTDLQGNYAGSTETDEALQSSLDVSEDTLDLISSMKSAVESSQITGTILDIPFMVVSGGYNALKLVFGVFDILTTLVSSFLSGLGVPENASNWVSSILIGVATITILFEILSAILKIKV